MAKIDDIYKKLLKKPIEKKRVVYSDRAEELAEYINGFLHKVQERTDTDVQMKLPIDLIL